MTKLSLAIRNAQIADGTGAPLYSGDVGVAGDRIVAVGKVEGKAAREIDAKGHVLSPGFIDIHTHYDPQLCWDRLATPSPEHGVTSLIAGNCSVSLAPVRPEDTNLVVRLFGSVEDMESRLLTSTIPFSWESFGQYLDYLKADLGPNVGVFLGHSNLRFYVMGAAAQERAATASELARMCDVLREALRAGAFGLSFTYIHLDDNGKALPSSFADRTELLALLQVMAEEGRGLVEIAPPLGGSPEKVLEFIDYWGGLALETGVLCSLSPLLYVPFWPDLWRRLLMRFDVWRGRGAPLYAQTQTRPLDMMINLTMGSAILSKYATLRKILEMPTDQRIRAFKDPATREKIEEEAKQGSPALNAYVVKRVASSANKRYLGRKLAAIAKREKKSVIMAMIDIALADDLKTDFGTVGFMHADAGVVSLLLSHPGIHIGSADAGAHITQFSGAGDTCYLFEKFVRQEGAMTVERAVQRLTSDLARAWNIKDRGEIAVGKFADLVVFDPATIARGEEIWVDDVPSGDGRYVRHPTGIDRVIVNGELLVDGGGYTEARPGRII